MESRDLHETVKFDPYPIITENPLQSIHVIMVSSSKDMGQDKMDAWIYGIAVGWDDAAYRELAPRHNWSDEAVARNKRLHEKFIDCWLYIHSK
jgi:hypothetical protein